MSVADNVLRATAFHALASCYPYLHRPMGGHPEHEILLRASGELTTLRAERDLLLAIRRAADEYPKIHSIAMVDAMIAHDAWQREQAANKEKNP